MPSESLKEFVVRVLDDVNAEVMLSLKDMTLDQLMWRPSPQSNSMAWLAWHIARLQDARAADLAGTPQLWISDGWHVRFGLEANPDNNGRGHTGAEVDAVQPESADALKSYVDKAHAFLRREFIKLKDAASPLALDGHSGDKIVNDLVFRAVHGGLAHAGQLMYVRGLVEKRRWFPR